VFGIPVRGDVSALFVATFLYVFALLSLGLLISTSAPKPYAGVADDDGRCCCRPCFSPDSFSQSKTMPRIFQWLSTLIPATYFIELMRAIMLRGANFDDLLRHYAILAAMGGVLFSLCALRFKQKIA
jgi:ABC-2 type transport system permease protein